MLSSALVEESCGRVSEAKVAADRIDKGVWHEGAEIQYCGGLTTGQ